MKRIDFLAIPVEWMADEPESEVLQEMDVIINVRDHFPVEVRANMKMGWQETILQRRKPIMQNPAVADPENVSEFKALCSGITLPYWSEHAHGHGFRLYSGLTTADKMLFRKCSLCRRMFGCRNPQ